MKELPFSLFYDLIEAAERAENEKMLFPFFVCGWATARIRGEQPPSFEEFMRATTEPAGGGVSREDRASPEEEAEAIKNEFAPLIAAEKERRERRG